MTKLPNALAKPPIIECVLEFQYEPVELMGYELLLGLLSRDFKDLVATITQVAPSVPEEILEKHPQLYYQVQRRLVGKQYQISVGPKAVTLSLTPPYPGWAEFRRVIARFLQAIKETDHVLLPTRLSLKYRNLLPHDYDDESSELSKLNVELNIADFDFSQKTALVRAETLRGGFVNIISLMTRTGVMGKDVRGLLLDIDTIKELDENDSFWENYEILLERMHDTEKEIFFTLLKPDVLETLMPEWE